MRYRCPEGNTCESRGSCSSSKPHAHGFACDVDDHYCPKCVPVPAKSTKPRWGGLPNSAGWYPWKACREDHGISMCLFVFGGADDPPSTRDVAMPNPYPGDREGFRFAYTGRTVGTIGGVWGPKVSD